MLTHNTCTCTHEDSITILTFAIFFSTVFIAFLLIRFQPYHRALWQPCANHLQSHTTLQVYSTFLSTTLVSVFLYGIGAPLASPASHSPTMILCNSCTRKHSREFYSQHIDCVQTAKNQISFIEYMYNSIQFESVALHSMVMSLCIYSCMDAGIAIKPVFDYYTTVILTSAVR